MGNTTYDNKGAYQYQQSIEGQLLSICDPLNNLGIKWFGYVKIFPDGSYFFASPNHKEFLRQYYFDVKSQGSAPTERIESAPVEENYYTMFSSKPIKKMDPVLHLMYSYDLWPVFCIYKNRSEFIEAYCFSMNKSDHCAPTFYLNNLNILEYFCNYFYDQSRDIIDCSDKQKLGYFEQQFNLHNNQLEDNFRAQQIEQFLQETYAKKIDLKIREKGFFSSEQAMEGLNYLVLGKSVKEISENLGIPSLLIDKNLQAFRELNKPQLGTTGSAASSFLSSLSPRQKECLLLLTRGKTAKQIGQTLGISHRTVETHIISLKSKMDCATKNQLIEKVLDAI